MRVEENCHYCKGTGKIEKWVDDDYSYPYGGNKWAGIDVCKCQEVTKTFRMLYTENESHTICGHCKGINFC